MCAATGGGIDRGPGEELEESSGIDLSRIGPLLKDARDRKSLSLESASEALFIKKSTLGAIESGYWDLLPHPVYVKGYVKSYASYLGIYDNVKLQLGWYGRARPAEHEMNKLTGLEEGEGYIEPRETNVHWNFLRRLLMVLSSVIGIGLTLAFSSGVSSMNVIRLEDVLIACSTNWFRRPR
ncbi:MAG: hypothetical protein A4E57_02143 [Syntrophorhabdaceae bacterium PtaU1.Bin034]|jgi:cytoskeletal protein RodZ|nr:MAG: hypothetical protein A4E57_02143 [Syntrophorhabdaceae bacterium PtaU1.Bin034]